MSAAGEPIESPDYPFVFRLREATGRGPTALVVALHGVGGDETQLAGLADRLPASAAVALPRGQRSISGDRLGWFRVGLGGDEPHVVEDEAEDALARLLDFIAAVQHRLDVPPARTWLCGFSQGGVLAATAALTAPDRMAGVAMLAGRLVPEFDDRIARPEALAHLQALVAHGVDDATLPVDGARDAVKRLTDLGVACDLRLHPGDHALTPPLLDDAVRWLSDRLGGEAEGVGSKPP